jgi:hypothetical protein
VLAPLGIEAFTPDQFLCNLPDLDPSTLHGCLQAMAARQRNPARSAQVLLQILSRQAPAFSSRMRSGGRTPRRRTPSLKAHR